MLVGTGIDIVEVARIKKAIDSGGFAERVFTAHEIAYCEERKSQKYASYAARFAAREAFVKALGSGFRSGAWTGISVKNDEEGCPYICLAGFYEEAARELDVAKVHLSLSHTAEWAVAQVILEGK